MKKYSTRTGFVVQNVGSPGEVLKILDVGFIGEYQEPFIHNAILENFRESSVVGIDISDKVDTYSSEGSRVYIKKSVYDLEADETFRGAFDVVVLCEVIEHLSNPWLAFANCAHSLRAGGKFIITFPNPYAIQKLISYALAPNLTNSQFINKFLGASDHLHFPLLPGMFRYGENLGLFPIEVAFMKGPGSFLPRVNRFAAYVGIVFEKGSRVG